MRSRLPYFTLLAALAVLLIPLTVFAAKPGGAIPKLTAPPEGENWFSIIVGEDRVGFAHQSIVRAGEGYRITSESYAKMKMMAVSRESSTKESYLVAPDLAITSFSVEARIDGKPLLVKGERNGQGLRVATETDGKKKERNLKAKGPVYPPQVLNIYPQLHGGVVGKSYSVPMFDFESVKIKQIKVEVMGEETLSPDKQTVHLQNNLYPIVDNDIWVDLEGNTLKESVRDDLVLTLAEDEKTAKLHLADDALAKKESVLHFSQVHLDQPIEKPQQLKRLVVQLTGYPAEMPILQGKGQQGKRTPDGSVIFTMPNTAYVPVPTEAPTPAKQEVAPRTPEAPKPVPPEPNAQIPAETAKPMEKEGPPQGPVEATQPENQGVTPQAPVKATQPGNLEVAPQVPAEATQPGNQGVTPQVPAEATQPGNQGVTPQVPAEATQPGNQEVAPQVPAKATQPGNQRVAPQAPAEATKPAGLEAAPRIPSDDPAIVAKKDEILKGEQNQPQAAKLLNDWVAKNIKVTEKDSKSPLETLKNGDGNSQNHARLYTALARAAGIPTRFVSGLVYAPEQKGFLYHSWAESYLDGWIPVDPTFGEVPANLTHIKTVEGDAAEDMVALAGLIGKLQAKVIEKQY